MVAPRPPAAPASSRSPPPPPAHALKGDAALYANEAAEVRALSPDAGARGLGRGLGTGVAAMLASRRRRHEAALEAYAAAAEAARAAAGGACAEAATRLAQRLARCDDEAAAEMAALVGDDARAMRLSAAEIEALRAALEARAPRRSQWLDDLEGDLAAAEAARRDATAAALSALGAALEAAAHADAGEQQRLIEREALALDDALLSDRRAAAEMLKGLHAAEAARARGARARSEAGRARWRELRSAHAVRELAGRLASVEAAEPPGRLALFGRLRDAQSAAAGALEAHLRSAVAALAPPALSIDAAAAWRTAAAGMVSAWDAALAEHLGALRRHEEGLEADARAALAALRAEVVGYGAHSPERTDALLEAEVAPALAGRRAAAARLLDHAEAFSRRRLRDWRAAADAVGGWLERVAAARARHAERAAGEDARVRAALAGARADFDAGDAAREALLSEALGGVVRAADERALDAAVEAALRRLANVEAGYRAHEAAVAAVVAAHAPAVRAEGEAYQRDVAALATSGRLAASAAAAAAAADGNVEGSSPGVGAPAEAAASGAELQADLFTALLEAAEAAEAAAAQHTLEGAAADEAQPVAVAGAAAADTAAAAAAKLPPPAKRQTKAEAVAAAAAAEAAAAAAAAAAEAAAAEAAAADAAARKCPKSSSGAKLCASTPVPAGAIRKALDAVRSALLSEAAASRARRAAEAGAFAQAQAAALTEALDERLRAHRPRAGRIEESARAARSEELIAQRRRLDAHLRVQSGALKRQQADFDAARAALLSEAGAWCAQLRASERLLSRALSVKGVDACWREAQAGKTRVDRQLAAAADALLARAEAGCDAIVAADAAYASQHLLGFEGGESRSMACSLKGSVLRDLHLNASHTRNRTC